MSVLPAARTARLALLFRDHLRSCPVHAQTWSTVKVAAAAAHASTDLAVYGGLKQPVWILLMELAEVWAAQTDWQPDVPAATL